MAGILGFECKSLYINHIHIKVLHVREAKIWLN